MARISKAFVVTAFAAATLLIGAIGCARAQEPTATPRPAATAAPGLPTATAVPATPTPAPAQVGRTEWVFAVADGDPGAKPTQITVGGGSISNYFVQQIVHEQLLVLEGYDLRPKPRAAESWEWKDDLTLVYHLRKGIKGQKPGTEFTSADVKYRLEATAEPKLGDTRTLLYVDAIETPDPYTVRVKFKSPDPGFPFVRGLSIAPKERKGNEEAYDKAPWSYGFYKPIEWQRDKPVKLEVFKDHYMGVGDPPRLTFIWLRDASTRLAALLAGQADVVLALPIAGVQAVKARPELAVSRICCRGLNWDFNSHPTHPYFSNLKVRQALNYAMNKEVVVNDILGGYGTIMGTFLIRGWLGYEESKDIKPYPYDPAKAVQLLKEAGLDKGFSFQVQSISGVFQKDQEIAEAYTAMWESIGLKPQLRIIERALFQQIRGREAGTGEIDWDIAGIGQWGPGYESDVWLSFLDNRGRTNLENPELEPFRQLLRKAQSTVDTKERAKLYGQMAHIDHDLALHPFSHNQEELMGLRRDTGWVPFILSYVPEVYYFNYAKLVGYGPNYEKWDDNSARKYWNN